jgi:hypothetical protein
MAASVSPEQQHIHHQVPRCLLRVYDRAQSPGLEPEDLQAWFDWQEEAFHAGWALTSLARSSIS